MVDNGDGTLGFFFTLRDCAGTRQDQVYYSESADNGTTWSNPVGIFPGGVTIGGAGVTRFALADVVVSGGQRVIYFNAYDASDNLFVGAFPPVIRPPVAAKPVPASSPASLALLGLLLLSAAAVVNRRRIGARR